VTDHTLQQRKQFTEPRVCLYPALQSAQRVSDTLFVALCVNSAVYNVTQIVVEERALISLVVHCSVAQILCCSAHIKLSLCLQNELWHQDMRGRGGITLHIINCSI